MVLLSGVKVRMTSAAAVAVLLLCSAGALDAAGEPVAKINASLTRGEAPLSVMFDALKSAPGDGEIVRYDWDFGDESPHNPRFEHGWLAAHRFERPGTYPVELTVHDSSGASAEVTVEVTVVPPAGPVYYFSSSEGDDSRTSEQARDPQTPWKSFEMLKTAVRTARPGTRLLLKRGDTFPGSNVEFWRRDLPVDSARPIVVGAYGEGPKPVIRCTSGALFRPTIDGVVLQDLNCQGGGTAQRAVFTRGGGPTTVNHLVLRRLTIEGFRTGIFPGGGGHEPNRFIFLEECVVRNNGNWGWLGGAGDHMVIRHCTFAHNGTSAKYQHNIYFRGDAFLIKDNVIHQGSGLGVNTHFTSDTIIRRNFIHHNGTGPGGGIGISTGGKTDVIKHVLVEGNYLYQNLLGMWLLGTEGLTVRNNVFHGQTSRIFGGMKGMVGTKVYHNTFYANQNNIFDGSGQGLRVVNNIFSRNARLIYAGEAVRSHNLYQRAVPEGQEQGALVGDPRFVDAQNGDFRLQAESPAVDGAAPLPVPFDFAGKPRPTGNAPDIGAHESGGPEN